MTYRITYVSNIDGVGYSRKFKTEKSAKEAWAGMHGPYTRYAIWVKLSDSAGAIAEIIAEQHHVYYLNAHR